MWRVYAYNRSARQASNGRDDLLPDHLTPEDRLLDSLNARN